MARFSNGANGAFSGKVGSVIGSNWRKVDYIRGLPKRSDKPASEKQKIARARFKLAVTFLEQIKDVLNEGFGQMDTSRATGYNLAVQYALLNAVTGAYPDLSIDYSKVLISKGSLYGAPSVAVVSLVPGKVKVTWESLLNKYNSFATDTVHLLLYNSSKNLFVFDSTATRKDEMVEVEVPEVFSNDTIHAYLFFKSEEKGRLSASIYAGPVVAY